jgi:SecD/SecF fusion protein
MFNNFHFDFLGVKNGRICFQVCSNISVISLATNGLDEGVDFVEEEHFKCVSRKLKQKL